MGKIVRASLKDIKPTQGTIVLDRIKGMLEKYIETEGCVTFPLAPAREDGRNYFLLDGHHRLVFADLIKKSEYQLFIPESHNDLIEREMLDENSFYINGLEDCLSTMNRNIVRYYTHAPYMEVGGLVDNIPDLRSIYGPISNLETAKKHFKISR